MMMGTLSMHFNSVIIPSVVLFDFGASHSFIETSYTHRHGLKISATPTPYLIDSTGVKVLVNHCVPRALIIINEMPFVANYW